MKRFSWVWILILAYIAILTATFLQGVSWKPSWLNIPPWTRYLYESTTVLVTVIMFLLIRRIDASLPEAQRILQTLDRKTAELDELRQDNIRIKAEVEEQRNRLRTHDALLEGRIAVYEKRYRDAIFVLRNAVRTGPPQAQAYYWLGIAHQRSGDHEKAVDEFKRATDLEPKESNYHRALGESAFKAFKPREAVRSLTHALALGVENSQDRLWVRLLLGRAQLRVDSQAGKETLRSLYVEYPNNTNVVRSLVRALENDGDIEEALEICNKGIENNHRDIGLRKIRADLLLDSGESASLELAQGDLDAVRIKNPDDTEQYKLQGRLYFERALNADGDERAELLRSALDAYTQGLKRAPERFHAPFNAGLALTYVVVGTFDEAQRHAEAAIAQGRSYIMNQECLYGALVGSKNWMALVRRARDLQDTGTIITKIYSRIFQLAGAISAGEQIAELRGVQQALRDSFRSAPDFAPRMKVWKFVRERFLEKAMRLNHDERSLAMTLDAFLTSQISVADFVARLDQTQ